MNIKEKKELKVTADDVTLQIAEEFSKLFSAKVQEIVDEFGDHLDKHMDELEDLIEDGFVSLHEHLKTVQRVEKLEKKIEELEITSRNKRYIV